MSPDVLYVPVALASATLVPTSVVLLDGHAHTVLATYVQPAWFPFAGLWATVLSTVLEVALGFLLGRWHPFTKRTPDTHAKGAR